MFYASWCSNHIKITDTTLLTLSRVNECHSPSDIAPIDSPDIWGYPAAGTWQRAIRGANPPFLVAADDNASDNDSHEWKITQNGKKRRDTNMHGIYMDAGILGGSDSGASIYQNARTVRIWIPDPIFFRVGVMHPYPWKYVTAFSFLIFWIFFAGWAGCTFTGV